MVLAIRARLIGWKGGDSYEIQSGQLTQNQRSMQMLTSTAPKTLLYTRKFSKYIIFFKVVIFSKSPNSDCKK